MVFHIHDRKYRIKISLHVITQSQKPKRTIKIAFYTYTFLKILHKNKLNTKILFDSLILIGNMKTVTVSKQGFFYLCLPCVLYLSTFCSHSHCAARLWIKNSKISHKLDPHM
ncbi:unknown [Pasteurella multocida subsp. multocida str. Pm70]|uniref:Uncharacterized protein n=1 Tax=Pasteurella multocida (strain Pm70) TaxID=272843 RepID=Q9CJN4_PASMU|nr:unknown [Pasteurella multocida subsp. multocida str. Pm70]